MARKLGRPTDQRMAMLKSQVTDLLWYGKIETTVTRGKEVARLAEKVLTLAINTYEDTVKVQKTVKNAKGESEVREFVNDGAKKLAARRKIMASVYDIQEKKEEGESKLAYKSRIRDIKHPLVEKIFNVYAPKYAKRNADNGIGGGYTKMLKLGKRRGDDAEVAILELV